MKIPSSSKSLQTCRARGICRQNKRSCEMMLEFQVGRAVHLILAQTQMLEITPSIQCIKTRQEAASNIWLVQSAKKALIPVTINYSFRARPSN